MQFLRNFTKLNKNNIALAGGKGVSLGEMTKAKILVPPGFVILSTAFEKFLQETNLNIKIDAIFNSINYKKIYTVENASKKLKL